MQFQDDRDMKIYGSAAADVEPDELFTLASQLDWHRKNGNLRKARLLGTALARLKPESFVEENAAFAPFASLRPFSAEHCYQLRVLMVFTAQLMLHRLRPPLSSEAAGALYASLEEEGHAFYEAVTEGSAFSFYYLPVRRDRDLTQEIGEQFAMLCAMEQNKSYRRLGSLVFSLTAEYTKQSIAQADFIPEGD